MTFNINIVPIVWIVCCPKKSLECVTVDFTCLSKLVAVTFKNSEILETKVMVISSFHILLADCTICSHILSFSLPSMQRRIDCIIITQDLAERVRGLFMALSEKIKTIYVI